jgi:hypothetical protein
MTRENLETHLFNILFGKRSKIGDITVVSKEDWPIEELADFVTQHDAEVKREAIEGLLKTVRTTQDPRPLYAWTDMEHLAEDANAYLKSLEPQIESKEEEEPQCEFCDGTGNDPDNSDGQCKWACPRCSGTGVSSSNQP